MCKVKARNIHPMLQTTYLFQMQQLQFLDLPRINQFLQITIKIFIALKTIPIS